MLELACHSSWYIIHDCFALIIIIEPVVRKSDCQILFVNPGK